MVVHKVSFQAVSYMMILLKLFLPQDHRFVKIYGKTVVKADNKAKREWYPE